MNKKLHRDSSDFREWDVWRTEYCIESEERVSVPSTFTWRFVDVSEPSER